MPRRYRSKIKGCHSCSQRRIDCDRTSPVCIKCSERGLACSGLGIRYRYRHFELTSAAPSMLPQPSNVPLRLLSSQQLSLTDRFFSDYFSQYIAPYFVVLDGQGNPYRDVVLASAQQYPGLKNAVKAACSAHLYQRGLVPSTQTFGYIEQVLRSIHSLSIDRGPARSLHLTTVLLLAITEIIIGGEIPHLYAMVKSLVIDRAYPATLPGDLEGFARTQLQLFQLFTEPFFDTTLGKAMLIEFMQGERDGLYFSTQETALRDILKMAGSLLLQDNQNDLLISMQQSIRDYQQTGRSDHALVWAYFVGAAVSRERESRVFFLSLLRAVYERTKFGNILQAINLIESFPPGQVRNWQGYLEDKEPFFLL